MMVEYIKLDDALDVLKKRVKEPRHAIEKCLLYELIGDIADLPTADVQEVRHERWEKDWCDNNLIGHEYEVCTGCGCLMIDTNQFWDSPHCPIYGADMRGKKA